jgi:hypothetical protein
VLGNVILVDGALEARAEMVARSIQQDRVVSLDRCIIARKNLEARQAAFEQALEPAPRRLGLAAAALVAAALAIAAFLPRREPPRRAEQKQEPSRILTIAQAREGHPESGGKPMEQTLQVEIHTERPARLLSGKLHIWSDPKQDRSGAEWEANGSVRYAVWKAGPNRQPEYQAESALRRRLSMWTLPAESHG